MILFLILLFNFSYGEPFTKGGTAPEPFHRSKMKISKPQRAKYQLKSKDYKGQIIDFFKGEFSKIPKGYDGVKHDDSQDSVAQV